MGKIFSILLALALVLSVGLVTGIPVQASVSQPQVTVSTVRTGEVAEYTIVFTITSTLDVADNITVEFPLDTTVPVSYSDGDITINANNVSHGDIDVVDRKVTMVTSNPIGAGPVTVVFTTNAGITNPNTAGDYTLWVNTSRPADQTPMESEKYPIRDLPAVTHVNPGKGNVGGTMWVVITGTSFMGDAADNNHSDTIISFGLVADVLQTKYISDTEINVQIKVKGVAICPVTAQTSAGNSTTTQNFTGKAAGTKQVDRWQKYTPSDEIFTVNTLVFGATYNTIGLAVAGAGVGHTLMAHSGLYKEDLSINVEGLTLMSVSGKDATTIKGVILSQWGGTTNPNIDILADGVKLHDFTIQGPEPSGILFAAGMIIGAQDVEIYNNAFEVNSASDTVNFDDVSQGIVAYHKNAIPGVDVSGLNIHDNTFTHRGTGSVGYEGIYINRDAGTGTVNIADNEFTGKVLRAITTERSNTVISDNTIITDLAPGLPGGYMGILVRYASEGQDAVSVVDNTVKGSAAGKGFTHGIRIGTAGQTLTNINVTGNTVQDNETGILVSSSAGGVVVNYNNIDGNTELGVENTGGGTLNALYNWWGHAIGPHHDTRNPGGQLNAVTGNVDFSPWLYKPQEQFASDAPCLAGSVVLANEAEEIEPGSYAGGWNSFSTPVTLDGSANTVSELLALVAAGNLSILRAQRFNLATQQWVLVIVNDIVVENYQIQPGEGFYIQVQSKGSLPILVEDAITSPPMRNLVAGWNLIGLSSLGAKTVTTALTGVEYSMVLSPKPPNDVVWSVPPSGAGVTYLQLGEAYWVAMAEPGILFGFTTTPVASDMTWDLNQ